MSDYYVCQNSHVSWRSIADHVLIVDHKRRQLLTLNNVAGTIWGLSDTWTHVDHIVACVQNIYDIDYNTAKQDVETFIERLLATELLITDKNYVKPSLKTDDNGPSCFNENIPANVKSLCLKNSIPLVGVLEITEHCNLHCQHCYNSPKRNKELSFPEITSTLDGLASLGCLDLLITGGEPTIRPDFSDIIWYGRKKKFSITVKTNATKIDKYLAQLLKKAFVAEVHVSMYSLLADEHDAITGVPNSLSKTLIGIENLRDADVKVHIACPLTKINYRSVKQVKEFALKIGAKCGFDPVITAKVNGDKSPINLRLGITELDQLYKSHIYSEIIFPHLLNTSDVSSTGAATLSEQETNLPICGAGSSMVCISAYGDVIPCVRFLLLLATYVRSH